MTSLSISILTYNISYLFIYLLFFFFNDTATTEIYTLSLHDALPILSLFDAPLSEPASRSGVEGALGAVVSITIRSEEHTSELQSRSDLVCRLLLEKKKKKIIKKQPKTVSLLNKLLSDRSI